MYSLVSKKLVKEAFQPRLLAVTATRSFTGKTDLLNTKEKGDERIFFTKTEGNVSILK